jgi:hypothetical protein
MKLIKVRIKDDIIFNKFKKLCEDKNESMNEFLNKFIIYQINKNK